MKRAILTLMVFCVMMPLTAWVASAAAVPADDIVSMDTEADAAELLGAADEQNAAGQDTENGTATLVRSGRFGENNGLSWRQYNDNSLHISGEGAIPDYANNENERAPWYNDRSSIHRVLIESGVTKIGNYAFYECGNMLDVTIPDTVSEIGGSAFQKCTSLERAAIPDSVVTIGGSAFHTCSNLSDIQFGSGLRTIKSHAFDGCANLTRVTLPDSLTSVEYAAFAACQSLTAFIIGDNDSFSVVDGVLFSKDLRTLVIYPAGKGVSYAVPEGTVTIGTSAFESAIHVTSVTLPNSLKSISAFAFCGTGLTSVRLPGSLESISTDAFRNCDSLTGISIPASVTSISGNPFYWSDNLREIRVDQGNARYCDVDGVLFTKNMNTLCAYPIGKTDTAYTVPDGVSIIGTDSFMTCKLTSVIFPDGVTEIKPQAFWNCANLENVTLPGSLTTIGWAFPYCSKLKDVYYRGSSEQWSRVQITAGERNDNSILRAAMHYSQISAGSAAARPSENVEIPITISLNPGLTVMRLHVSYDSSALKLDSVTDGGILGSQSHSDDFKLNPYPLFWNNGIATANFTADGPIATLKFKVLPDASDGEYPVIISYDSASNDIMNKNMRPVSLNLVGGAVTVTHIRYGDVNGDGSVMPKDSAILDRYLANWSGYQEINSENADVDASAAVDVRDSVILARHIASWRGFETLPYTQPADASLLSGDTGVIQIGTARGAPGDLVSVSLSLADNPGLTMMRLYVTYDGDALELRDVKDAGILGTKVHSDNYALNPYPLFWNNGTARENFTANGTAVTLLFQIKAGAGNGSYPVTVGYDAARGDILDCNLNPTAFRTVDGGVTVDSAVHEPCVVFVETDRQSGNHVTALLSRAESGATVWCGAYESTGKWISAWSQSIAAGQTEYVFSPNVDFASVKIMILDEALRPLSAYSAQ